MQSSWNATGSKALDCNGATISVFSLSKLSSSWCSQLWSSLRMQLGATSNWECETRRVCPWRGSWLRFVLSPGSAACVYRDSFNSAVSGSRFRVETLTESASACDAPPRFRLIGPGKLCVTGSFRIDCRLLWRYNVHTNAARSYGATVVEPPLLPSGPDGDAVVDEAPYQRSTRQRFPHS